MKVRIEIDTKTFVRFWLVVIGFAAVILALYSARTALTVLGIALFLALALNTPVSWLSRHLPGRSRTLSTAIAFLVVVAVLSAVALLVVPPIVQQTSKFFDSAPQMLHTVSEQWKGVGEFVDKYHIQPQFDQTVKSLQSDASRFASEFSKNFISGVGSALSGLTAALLTLALTFLMLVEGPSWLNSLWGLYTNKRRMVAHKRLVGRMHAVVSGYVSGQLTVSGIDAFCAGLMVFILSQFFPAVPANLALPTIAILFTLSLIPMFGALTGGIVVALLLLMNSIPAAIIFGIYFVIYQQVENNFITPTIQSRRIELSPLAILAAVTIGLYVFGIVGGIISIPIAGSIKVLLDHYLERMREEREEEDKPLAKIVKKLSGEKS